MSSGIDECVDAGDAGAGGGDLSERGSDAGGGNLSGGDLCNASSGRYRALPVGAFGGVLYTAFDATLPAALPENALGGALYFDFGATLPTA